jgi:hypothetical protein
MPRTLGVNFAPAGWTMLGRLGLLGFLTLGVVAAAAGCTIKTPEDAPKDDPTPSTGGSGGGSPKPGSSGTGTGASPSEGGSGGEPASPIDERCASCKSGLCLEDGTCVDCLPDADKCPTGKYCSDDYECVRGCKSSGEDCASGVCGTDRNCQRCIKDSECVDGFVCSAGQCAAACTTEQQGTADGCGDGLICCSEHCSLLTTDSRNCGGCGNTCASGQFCGLAASEADATGVSCQDTTLANVCSVSKVIVVLDTNKNENDGDRNSGRAIGAALSGQCPSKPTLEEAEQDSVDALNMTTGRPVSSSSDLLVIVGGPFFQNLQGYLEEQGIAPLYWKLTGENSEYRRADTDEVVASVPIDSDHESHDIFIIQFMRDPESGSLVLNAQGTWLTGSAAAAYHLSTVLLPDLPSQDKSWYAFDWTDKDGDLAPDEDEIQLLGSGG